MKPIGYYTSYTPGDDGLLAEMQQAWGSYFEELNQSERLWMLSTLTGLMCADQTENYNPHDVSERITPAYERFEELSFSDQLGLATALLDQLKASR